MKKTLYLMRHGQTLFNVRGKLQGWCDSPLTDLGIKQAKLSANYFKERNITFDYAYSSTSERASDTLELVTNMDYSRIKGLREWNFGVFGGESDDLAPKSPYGNFFLQYGGEGESEFQERISETIQTIMNKEDHNTVLIVSHGAACAQFYHKWEQYSKILTNEYFHNCCILKFEYENGTFQLIEINNNNFTDL